MSLDEAARLAALLRLEILDTDPEEAFDDLVRAAAHVCGVPISLVSLVDDRRQWFKARVGLDATQTPRDIAFCAHAIVGDAEIMEVPDATKDPRFAQSPLVVGRPDIRFYAGAKLTTSDGHALGTLCVIDRQPRDLLPWQRDVLATLGRQVVRLIELRYALNQLKNEPNGPGFSSLKKLIQEVPAGAVYRAGDRLTYNDQVTNIIGYRNEELPTVDRWFTTLHGEHHAENRRLYEQDRASGFKKSRIMVVRRKDGSIGHLEFAGHLSASDEVWLVRNVTDQINAEERFRVLFEHSSDAHLLFDESGIIDCNQAAVRMLGGTEKQQIMNLHPARLSPEIQPDGQRSDDKSAEMDGLAQRNGHHRFEWTHCRFDGSDIPVEVSLTKVELSGRPAMLVVWHDLTERKKTEEAERQRERRWLLALEASGDGVWDWDLETNRVFFSARWKAMLGYSEHEIGDALDEWDRRIHPDDKVAVYAEVKRHWNGEITQYIKEHRVLCKDGSWKWILDRGMVVERFPDGRPRRMIGTHADLTERRQMEERLRLEQARFRAMSDASPVGIFVTDVAGQATYLNDRWCTLAGMKEAVGLGAGWAEALHPDDREHTFTVWNRAVIDGGLFTNEHRFLHRDGRVVWTQVMAAPMHIAGKVVGYVGTVMDITDRYHNEQRLVDSLRRFDLVAAGASIGIWETRFDPEKWQSQITNDLPFYWSPRFIEIMGYALDEFPMRLEPWLQAMHPDDRERTLAGVKDCLAFGVPYNVEYRLRHKAGDYHWYHATGEAERDEQGRPLRFAGSMSDITARKRDEELLDQARVQLLDAVGAIDAGFAMFDAADCLVISNLRFAEIYGLFGDEQMPGTPYRTILASMVHRVALHDLSITADGWITERLAEHREPGTEKEFHLAGRWIHVAERRTADGGIVSLHTDFTMLKQAHDDMRQSRDLAEQAARAKSDFLATMSHEIRTPMNGVIGMTSLLLDTELTRQQRDFAETVRTCGDNLLSLINDILDFSKMESGHLHLEHISFSPRRLVEDAVALLAEQAQSKGLELVALISAAVPSKLLGDPGRLRQVVLNLLSNAIKFTARGEVVLTLDRLPDANGRVPLTLAIRDTGIGIPEHARERMFKAFTQADSSTTRKFGGTGLGLVICQRLVVLMGGDIDFTSTVGVGTEFTCRIILDPVKDEESPLASPGLVGKSVWLIGGHPLGRRVMREQVLAWGMHCEESENPDDIVSWSATKKPDLVVIDHDVRGGGLVIGAALSNYPNLANVPKILIATTGLRGMAAAATEAGFSGFLTKPLRQAQWFDCLLVVLDQRGRVSDQTKHLAPALVTRHTLAEDTQRPRVLVVEDNLVNRQVAVGMLGKLGCLCDVAANGQEAVEATALQTYQLVFMDCQMPVMDGFAATSAIRKREGGDQRVRIVALTANAMSGDRERCLASGMDDYISKPVSSADLAKALERARGVKVTATSTVSTPIPSSEPVIDDQALRALLDATDLDTVRSVIELMRNDAAVVIEELRHAAQTNDAIVLGRIAHRLKGSSGTLGMLQVQSLCQTLEQQARVKKIINLDQQVAAITQALGAALPLLEKHEAITGY
jgi:two-component system, sensor histidine kinase and response regulator